MISHSMVIYPDDVTVYSKKRVDHPQHLKQFFERCRKYGISINPKKIIFVVLEGQLLDHIFYTDGIYIDPKSTKSIMKIPPPHSKMFMQSFLGKINFLRRFVTNFVETVKPLHYYIWADYSMKIFHASISFIFFLNRAGFSSLLPQKFIAISTKILFKSSRDFRRYRDKLSWQ